MNHERVRDVFGCKKKSYNVSGGFRGGGWDVPPSQNPQKKREKKKCYNFAIFFHNIWWLKMQNFLGSLRSPALLNNIIKAYLT